MNFLDKTSSFEALQMIDNSYKARVKEQRIPLKHISFMPWLICALGAIFYCYEYFLRISPSVMTSDLMRTFDLTGSEVGNLSAFYYQAYVPMQIVVGLLMDRYGPRRLLTVACFLCALGTFLFAGNFGLTWASAGRFLVGFGSAFAFVGAMKLATIWLPANRFALLSGIIMCLGMIGAVTGDIMLRKMVDALGWQATIYSSAVVGVVLAVIIYGVIRDANPEHPDHHLHVIDFKNLFAGLWQALKKSQIWLNAIVGLLLYLSLCAFAELWGIPYLEQAQGFSKTLAAYGNAMIFLGWAIGSPTWGLISDFIGLRRLPILIGSVGAFFAVLMLLYIPNLPTPCIFILLFALGFFSGTQILIFAICHEISGMKIVATSIAFTNMVVMVGGNIFQPVIGKLLDNGWNGVMVDGARVYSAHAYHIALSVLPISIFVSIALTFLLRETYCSVKNGHVH